MKRFLSAFLFLTSFAWSQGSSFQGQAIGRGSQNFLVAIPNASVTVCSDQACTSPINLYTDTTLTTQSGNPVTADISGNYSFYAAPGSYFCKISASAFSPVTLPCSVPTAPGVDLVSNQTIAGNKTFTGTVLGPTLAQKYASSDSVIFVSTGGSDSNDGLSAGSAKATIAAALAALPSCTEPTDAKVYTHCGVIRIGAGTFTISSTIANTSPYVAITGNGRTSTILVAPSGSCAFTSTASPFNSPRDDAAVWSGFTILGNSASNSCGIHVTDEIGFKLREVTIREFTGTGAIGLWQDAVSGFDERWALDDVWLMNNTTDWKQTNNSSGPVTKTMGYGHYRMKLNCNAGQVCISSTGAAVSKAIDFSNSLVEIIENMSGAATCLSLSTNASWTNNGGLIHCEETSGVGQTGLSVDGTSTFNFLGVFDEPGTDSISGTVNITAMHPSLGFFATTNPVINGTGSGTTAFTICPNQSPFGTCTLNEYLIKANNPGSSRNLSISDPGGNDSFVFAAASQTLTNKSTSAGPVAGTVASGTATMTTAAIAAGACGTTVTVSATGTQTTDAIAFSFNASVGSNPGVLNVHSWPTANNVNFVYCNPTAGSVTPSAATLNWRVAR